MNNAFLSIDYAAQPAFLRVSEVFLYDFLYVRWYGLDFLLGEIIDNHLKGTDMKKILISCLMIGAFALPASAKSKVKSSSSGHIPYMENPNIDHSKDVAYSAQWADQAVSPAPEADFRLGAVPSISPSLYGKTYYYTLENFTYYGSYPVSMNAPYQGKDAPSYDGADRNAYRNMRANNESEKLPPNNGQ